MTTRSVSTMNSLAENQELVERNRNLELKLRYVQSINTIFRQRVGVLLQALTTKLAQVQLNGSISDSNNINLTSLLNTVNDSASLVQYQQQVDGYNDTSNNNNNNFSPASQRSASGSEVAYWQDRFIDAMSNIQPISQSEVETLCRLIREKVDRDALISQQESQIRHLQQQHRSLSTSSQQQHHSHPHHQSYADEVAEEVAALRQQLVASESRCKSLQFRLGEIRKKEQEASSQKSTQNLDLTSEVGTLMTTVRELRARLAEQESLNRRLVAEVEGLRSDKNLQLQHLNRMQGMCAAVMRESQCAVNEGLAATQMNETALLKRQLDTFELVLRRTEQEFAVSKKLLEDKEAQLLEKDREVQALQLRLESKEKTMDLYRQRCERMATQEKEQREDHTNAMNLLKARLGDAVGELQGAYTTKEIGEGLARMTTSAEKIAALSTQLTDMQKKYSTLRSCFAALSEELTLSSKQQRVPNLETVTSEEARVLISRDDSSSAADKHNVIIKIPREKVLRTDGNWTEVRDLNEGSVFYVTTSIVGTPFDPIPKETRTADAALAKPPAPPKQQQQQPPTPVASEESQSPPSSPKDQNNQLEPPTGEEVGENDDAEAGSGGKASPTAEVNDNNNNNTSGAEGEEPQKPEDQQEEEGKKEE